MAVHGGNEDAPWMTAYGHHDDDDSDTESLSSCMSETSQSGADPSSTVYVGRNLPPFVTAQHFHEHFTKHGFGGSITSTRVFYDKATRKSKGCGCVVLSSPDRAQEAVQKLNGTMLLNKHKLVVQPLKSKQKGQGSKKKRGRGNRSTARAPQSTARPGIATAPGVGTGLGTPMNRSAIAPPLLPHPTGIPVPYLQAVSPQPPQLQSGAPELSSSVVVENLSSQISEDEIRAMIQAPISECQFERTNADNKRATIRFASPLDASSAAACLNGKNLLGQVVRAFQVPSTPKQAMKTAPLYSVKVTHIPPDATEEMIRTHFQPIGRVHSCKVHSKGGAASYAHINFTDEQGARNAVGHLHQSLFRSWRINVSLTKKPQGKKQLPQSPVKQLPSPVKQLPNTRPDMHSPPHSFSVEAGDLQFTVKVSNLHPGIQGEELKRIFGHYGMIHSTNVIADPNSTYAYVNYLSEAAALSASANLHNTAPWPGFGAIRVQVRPPNRLSSTSTLMSPPAFQPPVFPPAFQPPVFPPAFQPPVFPPAPTQMPPQPEIQGQPAVHQPNERFMSLQPSQWNQLMRVDNDGSSPYQQLSLPFKTNPNVKIEPVIDQHALRFVGTPEAVSTAHKHFADALNRELHIADRLQMAALLNLYPQLADTVSQKYSISIVGYQEGSSVIRFEGSPSSVGLARAEFNQILSNSFVTKHDLHQPETLIPSLRKRLQGEGVKAYLCISPTPTAPCTPQVLVCAFTKGDHDQAVHLISQSPIVNKVNLPSRSCLSQLENHPEHNLPNLARKFSVSIDVSHENKLLVKGFVPQDVQTVRKLLVATVKDVSLLKEAVPCSPEQAEYLHQVLFQQPTPEGIEFLSSLPLQREQISYSGGKILLQGNSDAVNATCAKIMAGPLLTGLLHRSFSYSCHYNFLSQIQQYVLEPFKEANPGLIYTVPPEVANPSSKREERGFSVSVFSKDEAQLNEIRQLLESLSPRSRSFPVRSQAFEVIKKDQHVVERKYRVRIQRQGSTKIAVRGLTDDEIEQCWEKIEDTINSKLVISRHIAIDASLAKFLHQKRSSDIERWRSECHKLFVPKGSEATRDDLGLSIFIEGTVKQVKSMEEQVAEIKNAFSEDKVSVTCQPRFQRMWIKRWKQVKKEQEEKYDLMVEFQSSQQGNQRRSTGSEGEIQVVEVQFTICGPDREGIEAVKYLIIAEECDPHVLQKQIKLTPQSRAALLGAMKQKKFDITPLCVDLDVDREANIATLCAPQGASDDLEFAETEINRIVVDRTITTRQVTCHDPVVGLVLTSKSRSLQYLAVANSIARSHKVSVRTLKKPRYGLILTGNDAALKIVEPLIRKEVIDVVAKTIGDRQIKLDPIYTPVFNSPEFTRFDSKLMEDYCVMGSYPRSVRQSKLVKSTLLQPSSSAHCVKLEISKGSLIYDQVDAIVNAANEDLKHIGGLAKAILDAGGPSVQQESDEYVRLHGKVPTTGVVCLGPGKLPCKRIIHAVGPRWIDGRQNEEQHVYFTVYNSLSCASGEEFGSVALPAISAGIFGVPEEVCARASMKAVRDFCQATPNSTIHTIRFCFLHDSTLKAFLGVLGGDMAESMLTEPPIVASPMLPAHSQTCAWSWQERGSFFPYAPDISSLLTREYSRNPNGLITIPMQGKVYVINLAAMTQTNVATGHQRNIQRTKASGDSAPLGAQWYYTDDKGQKTPYAPHDSKAIEAMWQSRNPCPLQIARNTYTFDFNKMCQVNIMTNYRRAIERRENPPVSTSDAAVPKAEMHLPSSPPIHSEVPHLPQKQLVVVLRGPTDALQVAEGKLREKLKSMIKSNSVSLPPRVTPAFEAKLRDIARKNGVRIEVSTKSGGNKVTLKGLTSAVQHATSAIQEEIINHQISSGASSDIEYPQEWQQGQQSTTQLYPLTSGTPEYLKVVHRFQQTMPSVRVSQISRIQNVWLWEKYVRHKKMLDMKNAGAVNEKELFHGTRDNDPKIIYASEEGFDMRFSRQGMWGRANYFAESARYSHGYAHVAPDGSRVMFLVKVLTGDSFNCASDNSLQLPPVKGRVAGSSQVQFEQTRYDTVSGTTGGSVVYMTYDNTKAYPAYLISYR